MIQITRQLLRDWGACYTDDQIDATVPIDGLTPIQVLDRADVSSEDRLWVVLRESVIPPRELRLLACKWARDVLAVAGDPDPRSVAAVDCAERFARGEATSEELDAARDAARAAARDAARDAARAAASDAASDAAWDAAWVVAWDAAWVVAWAAQISDCRAALVVLAEVSQP